jgi:hypothetical protein
VGLPSKKRGHRRGKQKAIGHGADQPQVLILGSGLFDEGVMNRWRLLKRITVCALRDYDWASIAYPGSDGSARLLRCLRCGKESHGSWFPHLPYPPGGG